MIKRLLICAALPCALHTSVLQADPGPATPEFGQMPQPGFHPPPPTAQFRPAPVYPGWTPPPLGGWAPAYRGWSNG